MEEEKKIEETPQIKETPEMEEKKEETTEEKVDLGNMTVKELRELAKAKGLTGYSKMKKAELIDALK